MDDFLQIHRLKFNNFDLTSRVFGGALKQITKKCLARLGHFFILLRFLVIFRNKTHPRHTLTLNTVKIGLVI